MIVFTRKENIDDTYRKVGVFIEGLEMYKRTDYFIHLTTKDGITINICDIKDTMTLRGIRSNIILYDGKLTDEEMFQIKCKLIDSKANIENREPETLLAPISWVKYILSKDYVYIIQSDLYGEITIDFVGNNLLKALNCARKTDRCEISCYKINTDELLWSKFIINKRYVNDFIREFKS